jgi:hypothetical protein
MDGVGVEAPPAIGEILSEKKWRNDKSKTQCGPLTIEGNSSGKKWRKECGPLTQCALKAK